MIEPNCPGRNLPECRSCARAGSGDFFALIKTEYDKTGNVIRTMCLSYRRSHARTDR